MQPCESRRKMSLPDIFSADQSCFCFHSHHHTSMPSLDEPKSTEAHHYGFIYSPRYAQWNVDPQNDATSSSLIQKRKLSFGSLYGNEHHSTLQQEQQSRLHKIAKLSSMKLFPSVTAISPPPPPPPPSSSNPCDRKQFSVTRMTGKCDHYHHHFNDNDKIDVGSASVMTTTTTTTNSSQSTAFSLMSAKRNNDGSFTSFFHNVANFSLGFQFTQNVFLANSPATGLTVLSHGGSRNSSGSSIRNTLNSSASSTTTNEIVTASTRTNLFQASSSTGNTNSIPPDDISTNGCARMPSPRHQIKLIDNSHRATNSHTQVQRKEQSQPNLFDPSESPENTTASTTRIYAQYKRPTYFAPFCTLNDSLVLKWTNTTIGDSEEELSQISFDQGQKHLNVTQEEGYDGSPIIHNQFHYLSMAEKERFERLFREIDLDGNGLLDFKDLLHVLEKRGIKPTDDNVQHLIDRSDLNLDGGIDFAEFVSYCLENEKQLHVIFKNIDLNEDGKIDAQELVYAFQQVGLNVSENEALHLVRKIKRSDNKQSIEQIELNFEEFRDYLLLHPTSSFDGLLRSWRHGTFINFGVDGSMPVEFSEKELKSGLWWRHLIAGGIAGAVSRTATAPLDRLKIFLQVRSAEFNGLGICLRHMLQEGGVLSLWRGNGINVLKIAPETAIKFMAFDQIKRLIHQNPAGEVSIGERFVSGSLAGAISQTVIYPMEVLKTRFCLRETGQYKGLVDAAKKINSNGGIKNFYRGYIPNLIGIIPYAGIDLTIYETLKKMYLKKNSLEEAPIFVCLACGTLSSTFGQIASYPLALIRTRMQSETGNHRSSMVGMFRSILHREGCRGMYRGITANIMKVAPAVSISYVVYEYTRRPLGAVMS